LFNKSFDGSCVPFDVYYKWPQLYKIRKNCKLLTWGSNQFSRLGVTDIPISLTEKVTFSGVRFTSSRLIKPVVLDLKDFGGVLNLTAGGFISDRSSRYGPATAMVTVVEGTSDTHDIVDYLVLEDCIIYLTQDGTLYRVKWSGIDLSTALSVPKGEVLHSFQKYATRHSRDHMSTSKFVRISGSFNKFTAITNDDQVLLGDKNSLEPKIIKELQYRSIIAVAVGDHHFLALDKEGKMYSWGKELEANGCLGLGKLSTILEEGMGRLEGNAHQRTVIVEKPHLVPIDGVVLAIAAGGWQSAALVYK
ncbi:hypothetical protein CANARDRAFT_186280, partial [[Candida] arabinofermentans NRRL YB-2248]